jgi:hypothetical protein
MQARRHIRLTFVGTGESVIAELLDDEAPKTCQMIWNWLPLERDIVHGRVSGLELLVALDRPEPAPAENQAMMPLPGEILYVFVNNTSVTGKSGPAAGICFIYGRGVTLRGAEGIVLHGNLFARIPGDWKYDWVAFQDACLRVRHASARLRMERVEGS